MKDVRVPDGFRFERLRRAQSRKEFCCGEDRVDQWLATMALQNQQKHLSVTIVLLDTKQRIAGYYTLATSQVDFNDLPVELRKRLPRRMLPVAVVAWLGVDRRYQSQGLGDALLGHALRECYSASTTFPFVAVMLDCIDETAKGFYMRWDFEELPGHPLQLFLAAERLEALVQGI